MTGVAGQHPAAIDHEDDPLTLIELMGADRQLATARGRPPVHEARLIPFDIVAQSFKFVVRPQPSRVPDPHAAQTVAARQDGVPANLADIGINANRGRLRPGHLPLPEP